MGKYVRKGNKTSYDNKKKLAILFSYDHECGKSPSKCAKKHNVPQSTISTWLKQRQDGTLIDAGTVGTKSAIPLLVENDLVNIIIFLSDCGQNMDRDAIRDLVKSFLDHMQWKVTRFRDNRPGLDWCRSFENRHKEKISRRKRQGLSYARASGLTDENVQKFYKLWQALVNENNVRPENMWNCDESGFQPNPKGGLVYINNQNKDAYELAFDNSRETYTVLFTCSPAGKYLPPFICYKGKLVSHRWTQGGPPGT